MSPAFTYGYHLYKVVTMVMVLKYVRQPYTALRYLRRLVLVYIPKVLPLLLEWKLFITMETPHPHANNGANYYYFQSYIIQGSCE